MSTSDIDWPSLVSVKEVEGILDSIDFFLAYPIFSVGFGIEFGFFIQENTTLIFNQNFETFFENIADFAKKKTSVSKFAQQV